jgi:hypothetical protein
MNNWIDIIKKFQAALLDQPFLASVFIIDFGILLFHSPPIFFSLIMVGGLVAMSMYFGQKLAFFNLTAKPAPIAAAVKAVVEPAAAKVTAPAKTETKAKPKAKPKT